MRTPIPTVWSMPAGCLILALAPLGGCTSASPGLEEDLRAIEALNQHDVDAVLSSDVDALISQWTDDFVVITQGSIVRGRDANAALMEPAREMPASSSRWSTCSTSRRRSSPATTRSSGAPSDRAPGARVRGGILRRRQADANPAAPGRRLVEDAPDDDRPGSRRRVAEARGGVTENDACVNCPAPVRPPNERHGSTRRARFDAKQQGRCAPSIRSRVRRTWALPALIAPRDRWRTQGNSSKAESCFRRSSTTPSGSATIPERTTTEPG